MQAPTFDDFEALKRIIDARSDVGLKILPSKHKGQREGDGFTKFSPKANKPVIHIYLPNASQPEDIANCFQTLHHEFIHALHFTKPSIIPVQKRADFDLCTRRLEDKIYKERWANKDWQTLFQQDSMISSDIARLSIKSLNAMKITLMTEAVAYELTQDLGTESRYDRNMSQGYKAAIQFVNNRIATKELQGNSYLVVTKRQKRTGH